VHCATAFFALVIADVCEELAGCFAFCEEYAAFLEGLADGSEAVRWAVLVSCWLVLVGYRAVVGLGQGAAREDMRGSEARRLLYSMKE
jgi:hypothetical protein